MTTKDAHVLDPWQIWPEGTVPAEGNRPEWRLRTAEEGMAWLKGLAEFRKAHKLPENCSSLDILRQERDEQ